MLKFFRNPFATSGDKTAVPETVDPNGNVSYPQGYSFDYQRQKTDPASKNIERDKMNQIFFDITSAIAEIQAQGIPDFITPALNGGTAYPYAKNAVVRFADANYVSLVTANTATPADVTKWALLPTPERLQKASNSSAVAGGTANALTAAFVPAIAAYPSAPETLSVLVRATAANTTTTPTLAVDGLAAKTIVKGNNMALAAGDIIGAGHWLDFQFDPALDKWVLQNPAKGITVGSYQPLDATLTALAALVTSADKMIYATGVDTFALNPFTAFARTLLDDPDAATALVTLGVIGGATYSMGASGYVKLPSWLGGLIIQWTKTAVIAANASVTVSFPTTFPGSVFAVFGTPDSPSAGEASAIGCVSFTTSSAVINNGNTENNEGAYVLAFGY